MTSAEFVALRSDLRDLAVELGEVRSEVFQMKTSLAVCQSRCHVDNESHRRHVRWTVAALTSILAAVVAAALSTLVR